MALQQARRRAKTAPGNYTDYTRVAYNTAFSIIRHKEDAEDVAQVTTMRLVLNEGRINKESERNWVITTARNESFLMLEKNGRDVKVAPDSFDRLEQEITDYLLEYYDPNHEITDFMNHIKETASPQDWELLNRYLSQGRKLRDLYPYLNSSMKKSSVRQKLYRLRKELRTQYYKRAGVTASKQIVNFNLNQNILRFLKKYKQCLEARSFESMSRYLQKTGIPSEVPRINIKRIVDYDIRLVNSEEYEIFVFYIDNRKVMNAFTMAFWLDDKGNMVLKDIPNSKNLVCLHVADLKEMPDELVCKLKDKRADGCLKVKGKDLINEIKSEAKYNYKAKRIKKRNNLSTE
jgi:DNA-directed RNA polymerase specialized sigma24 family protein